MYQVQGRTDAFRTVVKIEVTDSRYFFTNGQGGGGGPLAVFLRVSDFCSMTSNRLVGDTYVALVDSQRGGKGGHT